MISLFSGISAFCYFTAVSLCYYTHVIRTHGAAPGLQTSLKLNWPPTQALLIGFAPGAALSFVLVAVTSLSYAVATVPAQLGLAASGVLLHRHLLRAAERGRWTVAIVVAFVALCAMFAPLLYRVVADLSL